MVENLKKGDIYMNVADYTSNDIKIVELEKNCKGVFAVKPIKKGTLLVVSKAISVSYENEKDDLEIPSVMTCIEENTAKIIIKMDNDPELAKQIYYLYAG